jgi:hypothetical protein
MKCAVHTDVDAVGYCQNCGKALCADCRRDVRGILYCETCLADLVAKPQVVGAGPSPGLAAVIGWIPGLGPVYNGEYMKALVYLLIFVAFIGALNSDLGDPAEPILGLMLTAFMVFTSIDSYRTAKARRLGQAPPVKIEEFTKGRPVGPVILIGLGVLFLLNQFHLFPMRLIFRHGWPLFLIAVGVWLLWRRTQQTS